MNISVLSLFRQVRSSCMLILLAMMVSYSAFADDDGLLIKALVPASLGGSFTDNPDNPTVTVTVPPGALNADARLRVSLVDDDDADENLMPNQMPASPVYNIRLSKAGGKSGPKGKLQLNMPITLELSADPTPTHPQLGEIAIKEKGRWQRLDANFYRASDTTVVSLTDQIRGKYRVMHRQLQTVSGAAVERGRDVLMYETFGNENFFGDVIGLHTLLNNVDPVSAVSLGVQVDLTRVPAEIVAVMVGDDLDAKDAALADPATTRALIKAGAVIGVKGVYATDDPADNEMIGAGLTCSLCHVNAAATDFELNAGTVALPIGAPQFNGVPNTSIDAGTILSLTPFVQNAGQAVIDILQSWGPGLFDIRALPDNPLEDNAVNPTINPPIWNFVDLAEQGYTFGWDGLFVDDGINNNALASQAEAVYDLVMHGNGAFGMPNGNLPPELSVTPPQALVEALVLAETLQPGNDIDTDKLLDLQAWMRSITSPSPGVFDEAKAEEGFQLFYGKANCVACHSSPELTGPGLFTDITEQPPTGDLAGGIHVPGLRGVSYTAPYFHDASAASLSAAVTRLVERGAPVPPLNAEEQDALVEYLKSL